MNIIPLLPDTTAHSHINSRPFLCSIYLTLWCRNTESQRKILQRIRCSICRPGGPKLPWLPCNTLEGPTKSIAYANPMWNETYPISSCSRWQWVSLSCPMSREKCVMKATQLSRLGWLYYTPKCNRTDSNDGSSMPDLFLGGFYMCSFNDPPVVDGVYKPTNNWGGTTKRNGELPEIPRVGIPRIGRCLWWTQHPRGTQVWCSEVPFGNQTWQAGKYEIPVNWSFNGKII